MRRVILGIAATLLLAGTAQVALSQAPYTAPSAAPTAAASPAQAAGAPPAATNYQSAEYMELGKQLPNAKHTLAEILMTVTKGTEVPIEVKFEMHEGKLFVGAYTSAKGLNTSAESNSFKEYNGDATMAGWMPATETFTDLQHIARSAQYHTLLTMTKLTIADMVKKASATPNVTVVSVKEMVRSAKPVFEVVTFQGGAFKATYYDLVTGDAVAG